MFGEGLDRLDRRWVDVLPDGTGCERAKRVERMTRFELATSTVRLSVAFGATTRPRKWICVERMTRFELATSTVRLSVAFGATTRPRSGFAWSG